MTKPVTEAVLIRSIHKDLIEKLQKANGKPLLITVTYQDDDNENQHWIATNNDFPPMDILTSLLAMGEDANKNLIPKTTKHVQAIKDQLGHKKRRVSMRKQ